MTLNERIDCFARLGKILSGLIQGLEENTNSGKEGISQNSEFLASINKAKNENPWFIDEHILFALKTIASSLDKNKIDQWINKYDGNLFRKTDYKTIGVVMAGNLPLVGFHDFLCVLMAGHRFYGKLSSEDAALLPAISNILIQINPDFKKSISFTTDKLSRFDAIIATGSNNTNRYFEYYFGKYPNILRKSRNGIAILTGEEAPQQLSGLADDIFLYFGKGCRNVSKVYLPENYDINLLKIPFYKYHAFYHHHKYRNNYDYYKALFQVSSTAFHDFGFLLLKEEKEIASPISILNFEFYKDLSTLKKEIATLSDQIQCVICHEKISGQWILPGNAQRTELWDYADGIDTMDFLLSL